jgi:hypothetical protein
MTRKAVDWEAVEREYRAGIRSLKDIGAEFGVSDAGILKRAKKEEWQRDLTERIRAKAEAKVSAALVSEKVSAESNANERIVVEASAQVLADALLGQRRDVSRSRSIVQKLFDELEAQGDGLEELAMLGEALESGDEEKLAQIARKVIAFPSRVDSAKKLAESLRTLVELERKVLRIKDDTNLDDFAKKIGEGAALSGMDAYRQMCNGG